MDERKIGIVLIIIGIGILVTSEKVFSPLKTPLSRVDEISIGEKIISYGTVKDVYREENIKIIRLKGEDLPELVKFSKTEEKEVETGENISFRGEIGRYHGDRQIVVDELNVR